MNAALGRNNGFMSNCKKRGSVPNVALGLLCKSLDCTVEDLVKTESSHDNDDTYIIQELGEIKGKISAVEMTIFNIYNDIQNLKEIINPDLLTDKDKAVLLLKQMLGDNARVDEHDYITKCNEIG